MQKKIINTAMALLALFNFNPLKRPIISKGSTPNKYKKPHQGKKECARRIRQGLAG